MEGKAMVLVIDDEPDLVEMIAYQFRSKNYTVETAFDGVEGLEKLKTISPQLIILDLNMPRMSGFEFYQNICGANGKPSHPVLILTARANTEDMFRDLDIDGFMAKPFEIDNLIKEAETIIQKHARVELVPVREQKKILHTIYVVDNDLQALDASSLALLKAGYRVAAFKTAAEALQGMFEAPPDLALVKLGLADIPGDVVVQRALRMAKTSVVKFILFEPHDSRHIKEVRERFAEKTGVIEVAAYDRPEDLVGIAETGLKGLPSEEEEGV